jgi:hypothetical protein
MRCVMVPVLRRRRLGPGLVIGLVLAAVAPSAGFVAETVIARSPVLRLRRDPAA